MQFGLKFSGFAYKKRPIAVIMLSKFLQFKKNCNVKGHKTLTPETFMVR